MRHQTPAVIGFDHLSIGSGLVVIIPEYQQWSSICHIIVPFTHPRRPTSCCELQGKTVKAHGEGKGVPTE